MKYIFISLLLMPLWLTAQRREKAPIQKVTVFTSGAQIEHAHTVSLKPGKQIIVFAQLTDFIDPNSIQVRASDNVTILSVRTHKNFDETAIAKMETDSLNAQRKRLENQKETDQTAYGVLLSDEQLLNLNSDLKSEQQAVKISELKEASVFFHARLMEIQAQKTELENRIEATTKAINSVTQEIQTRRSLPVTNYTEIEVEIDVATAGNTTFLFSYITPNASWKPYYDMRSAGIGQPVKLEAKALVNQHTGIDWGQVQLVLSTNDPYDNTQEAEIYAWYLNYNVLAPRKYTPPRPVTTYDYSGETVYGEVIDAVSGEALAFAKLTIHNSPLIISTDAAGRFSFTVPRGTKSYGVSYLGYTDQWITINAPFTKVMLQPESIELPELQVNKEVPEPVETDEVYLLNNYVESTVSQKKSAVTTELRAGVSLERKLDVKQVAQPSYKYQPVATVQQKDLRMEFTISTPFTIPSDNADHRVAIAVFEMPAAYEYHSVPKLDPSMYLVAQVTGWEKLNLLSGESNIYFDGTFIGKSYLDVQSTSDTLHFSLGKDRKMVIERKRSEHHSKSGITGKRKHYEVQWDFTVRNNGSASGIPVLIKDHFPIAVNEDIKVKQGEYAGAQLDEKTGILTWKLTPKPGQTNTFSFDYSVEYNSQGVLYLE